MTDLLVLIEKLEKLSKSLEETRGSFNVYEQNLRQLHQSLMQPLNFEALVTPSELNLCHNFKASLVW